MQANIRHSVIPDPNEYIYIERSCSDPSGVREVLESIHERLDNIEKNMATIPVLAEAMVLSQAEADHNRRHINSSGDLFPLMAWKGPNVGKYPAEFPVTTADLLSLGERQIAALLAFYDFEILDETQGVDRLVRVITLRV
jgi:hypothetical protein